MAHHKRKVQSLTKLGSRLDVLSSASDYLPAEFFQDMQRLDANSTADRGHWQDIRDEAWF
jgi:hypothetical protein